MRLSRGEAREEFNRQEAIWRGKLSPKPASETKSKVASADQGSQPEAELRLMTPEKTGMSEMNPPIDSFGSVASKVDLAMEMADTVSQENENLRFRLAQLEKQIDSMQTMLSLRNQQLAEFSVRKQSVDFVNESNPVNEFDLSKDEVETAEFVELNSDGLGQDQVELGQDPSVLDQELDKFGLDQEELNSTVEPVLPAVTQNAAEKQVTKPSANPIIQDNDLLSEILENPYYLAATLSGILILGLLIVKLVRRRNAEKLFDTESEMTFNEEIVGDEFIEPEQEDSVKSSVEESPSEDMMASAAESSFLSEFTPSDFDAFEMETDEVDPISEADVYLAYGRYQQAENLIRQAINDSPDRVECKLKLLEIHFATENKEAFESYAMELKEDNVEIDPSFWDKVVEMGRELCPDSAIFKDGVELTESLDDMLSEGLELSEILGSQPAGTKADELVFEQEEMIELDAEQKTPVELDSGEISENVDVELTDLSDSYESHFEQDAKVVDSEDENSIQFESGELSDSVEETVISNSDKILSPSSQNEGPLEFNLSVNDSVELEANSLDNVSGDSNSEISLALSTEAVFEVTDESSAFEAPLTMESDTGKESNDVQLDFDMEFTLPGESGIEEIGSDTDAVLEISELDLDHVDTNYRDPEDMNIDAVAVGGVELPDNAGSSTISDMDEIEAKLDLAKAYVGMDDQDSASEILMEVLDQGSEEQKVEAQALAETLKKQSSMYYTFRVQGFINYRMGLLAKDIVVKP